MNTYKIKVILYHDQDTLAVYKCLRYYHYDMKKIIIYKPKNNLEGINWFFFPDWHKIRREEAARFIQRVWKKHSKKRNEAARIIQRFVLKYIYKYSKENTLISQLESHFYFYSF